MNTAPRERETWTDTVVGLTCRVCGRAFKRPEPRLHYGRGVRRWAVGFSQTSSRKGLSRALKTNHRKACPDYGPLLPR